MQRLGSWSDLARAAQQRGLLELVREFGPSLAIDELGWPAPEVWAARVLLEREPGAAADALDSIPFGAFCQTVLAPLLALSSAQQQRLFGRALPRQDRAERELGLERLLAARIGLTTAEKLAWLSGEHSRGWVRPWSEERILAILAQSYFLPLEDLRRGMIEQGGVAALAAGLPTVSGQPASTPVSGAPPQTPLSARVASLCLLQPPPRQHACWPQLLRRASPLERYILVARLSGKLDLSWGQRQETLLRLVGAHYGASYEAMAAAHALEDLSRLVERLEQSGPEGLSQVVLRPLAAFRPALAVSQQPEGRFPCWVECKYDGIRLLVHKELDGLGNQRQAAYTRRRNDWSELIPGLGPALSRLNAASLIVDGELHGRVLEPDGVARPATVYEVHECLRGEIRIPLRLVVFDLLYAHGRDLTRLPFQQRRQLLEQLLAAQPGGLAFAGALPLELSQGSRVDDAEQLNRLYQQFRRQGHEGCMIKDLDAPYPLAQRSPAWQKRKPLETVDLVLTAAFWGEGSRPGARMFDSYALSARVQAGGGWREVGTVVGLDQRLTAQVVAEIWSQQLLTGASRQKESPRGLAHGVELRPYLVVTVAYEEVLWDHQAQEVSLRSPRIHAVRSGEMPLEESSAWEELQRLALRSRLN